MDFARMVGLCTTVGNTLLDPKSFDLFHAIVMRTLGRHKLKASFPMHEFVALEECLPYYMFPVKQKPRTIRLHLSQLRQDGWVFVRMARMSMSGQYYCKNSFMVNVPGVVDFFAGLGRTFEGIHNGARRALLEDRAEFLKLTKVEEVAIVVDDRHKMSVEDMLKKADKVSNEAMKKRLVKYETRGKANWIPVAMKEMAEENGLTYNDTWAGKVIGFANQWIKECIAEEKDPRAELSRIIKHWNRMSLEIKDYRNNRLLPVVSFSQLFKFRRQIKDWLLTGEDRVGREEGTGERVMMIGGREVLIHLRGRKEPNQDVEE